MHRALVEPSSVVPGPPHQRLRNMNGGGPTSAAFDLKGQAWFVQDDIRALQNLFKQLPSRKRSPGQAIGFFRAVF
jgi:hypothetical protein